MFSIRMVVTQFYTCEKLIKLSTYDLYTYDYCIYVMWASLVAQRLKRLPAMRETWVRSLGQEDPLEKEMATHSSTLVWRIPWREEPGRLQSMGSQRVGHDWATSLTHSICHIIEIKRILLNERFPKEMVPRFLRTWLTPEIKSGLLGKLLWYCNIEWFALEKKRDHSVAFEIASKYCISDSCWLWRLLHFF